MKLNASLFLKKYFFVHFFFFHLATLRPAFLMRLYFPA